MLYDSCCRFFTRSSGNRIFFLNWLRFDKVRGINRGFDFVYSFIFYFVMKSYPKYNIEETYKQSTNTQITITLQLLTCSYKLYNFTDFISIQDALIIRTIPIPAPYQITNKVTQSLSWLTHSPATVLPYCSIHISNSWFKITSFKFIPSRAECEIYTHYRHSSSKNYAMNEIKRICPELWRRYFATKLKDRIHESSLRTFVFFFVQIWNRVSVPFQL